MDDDRTTEDILESIRRLTPYEDPKLAYQRGYEDGRLSLPPEAPSQQMARRVSGELFLRTREWIAVRNRYLATVEHVCATCGSTHRIVVDHVLPRSRYPELALTPSNFQVLCWDCNMSKACRK